MTSPCSDFTTVDDDDVENESLATRFSPKLTDFPSSCFADKSKDVPGDFLCLVGSSRKSRPIELKKKINELNELKI